MGSVGRFQLHALDFGQGEVMHEDKKGANINLQVRVFQPTDKHQSARVES